MMAQIIKWIFAGLLQTELSITPLIFIVLLIHKAAYKIKPRTWIWIWSALGIRLLCIIPIYFPAVGHTQSQNEIALSAYLGDTAVNALLGCHNLALSCCHEIARISVMECSFCDGADSRPITKGISSCIHALPAL